MEMMTEVETMPDTMAPAQEPAVAAPVVMPNVEYRKGGLRYTLIMHGVCTHCAHCGLTLTDPTSQEAGMGPICRGRGYNDDPVEGGDEVQALIDLAEYPQLVDFFTKSYKDKGKHAMMVGLVKIASLNRRTPVHKAITDAVESLGYKRLASTLRESLAVIEIKEHDEKTYNVWVKKSEFNWLWYSDLRKYIPTAYMSKQHKGIVVPKSFKRALWELLLKHYEGLFAKVPDGHGGKKTVKIAKKVQTPPSQPRVNAT